MRTSDLIALLQAGLDLKKNDEPVLIWSSNTGEYVCIESVLMDTGGQ